MCLCVCVFVSINELNVQLFIILVTCDMKCDVFKHQLLNKFDRPIKNGHKSKKHFFYLDCDKMLSIKEKV